jgi:hypothetical protein
MSFRQEIRQWVLEAIDAHSGRAAVIDVAKYIWEKHESDLRAHGDAFYTWQYDMRWAAQSLRNKGILVNAATAPRGIWERRVVTA